MAKTRTFYVTVDAPGNRQVTLMGVQSEATTTNVITSNPKYSHKRTCTFEIKQHKKRVQVLDIAIAIKHADDKYDKTIVESILKRRMKRKHLHMHITSPQFMGDDFCKAILHTEAKYIANHIDKFCEKIKEYE